MLNIALVNALILLMILFLISWLFIAMVLYFIPLIVAHIRKHNNIIEIGILNVVLGWTFFGWLASLLWALNSDIKENNE